MGIAYLPDLLRSVARPRVLELGSRHVTARAWARPPGWEVVGVDIRPGPGVDVVCDAHALSAVFRPASFDAVYSHAVFEHLLLPWKVALEISRVLRVGGLAWVVTHEAFPIHEWPWDFWRFGRDTWPELFSKRVGFEILGYRPLEPVTVRPRGGAPFQGHAGCEVQVRKMAEPDAALVWDVSPAEILPPGHAYPLAAATMLRRAGRAIRERGRRLARVRRPPTSGPGPAGATRVAGAAAREALARLAPGSVARLDLVHALEADPRPWSLVREINRVLEPGGRVRISTVHTAPGDFPGWRLSSEGLLALFHSASGFRLVERSMHGPCRVAVEGGSRRARAYLRTHGVALKTGPFDAHRLSWDVDLDA